MYIPPGSVDVYTLDVTTPWLNPGDEDLMSICDVRVTTAGWNLPCVNDTQMDHVYSSSNDNETFNEATLDMGWIGNSADSGLLSDQANMVSEASGMLCKIHLKNEKNMPSVLLQLSYQSRTL